MGVCYVALSLLLSCALRRCRANRRRRQQAAAAQDSAAAAAAGPQPVYRNAAAAEEAMQAALAAAQQRSVRGGGVWAGVPTMVGASSGSDLHTLTEPLLIPGSDDNV